MAEISECKFYFNPLPAKKFSFLQDKETLALLMKWSMLGRISAKTFSFDHNFLHYNSEKFALDFFKDPVVVFGLKHLVSEVWVPLDKPVVSVHVEPVPCSRVSTDLFDPLYTCGILRPSGLVVKCLHEVHQDYDKLRQMLKEKEFCVAGREDRAEFLFCLFKHLCLGGELCQYEDSVDPYIRTTKKIYRDLISVQKDPETKKISVVSKVFRVWVYDDSGRCFPGTPEEDQTFAYMIVDPQKRHVTLFCHFYGIGNFSF
uniref:Cilia- and flagella-associated protein 300 n=1 Tax=Oryzias latipes TaxID=8090 RepID=A0A3P9HVP2_ORYLA